MQFYYIEQSAGLMKKVRTEKRLEEGKCAKYGSGERAFWATTAGLTEQA